MDWVQGICEALRYIEDNITEEPNIGEAAKRAYVSPIYFQKGFAMLCGYTVGEYIRLRKLALAGLELVSTEQKIIDLAVKYGYDSPDSFTKAFTRFHGSTPTAVRKDGAAIKSFAPLKINFTLIGGTVMDYKIVQKEAFTVIGASRMFSYEASKKEIPDYWTEHFLKGNEKYICGMYGVCIDEAQGFEKFEYLIADNYNPAKEYPEEFVTKLIPKHTWAVFPCRGAMPDAIQEVNRKIYNEWLPGSRDYAIAAGYNIEMYAAPCDYPKGTQDENYYSEVWIPIEKK